MLNLLNRIFFAVVNRGISISLVEKDIDFGNHKLLEQFDKKYISNFKNLLEFRFPTLGYQLPILLYGPLSRIGAIYTEVLISFKLLLFGHSL